MAAVLNEIKSLLSLSDCSAKLEDDLLNISKYFCLSASKKWKNCNRTRDVFNKRNSKWLNTEVKLPKSIDFSLENKPTTSCGRPRIPFEKASLKTKKRRVEMLVAQNSSEELHFAAERSRMSNIGTSLTKRKSLTNIEALALYLDLDLSVRKYNILRSVVNSLHQDCFPSFHILNQFRNQYFPSNITVTELSAEVDLQEILERTTESILKVAHIEHTGNLKLICKWGFDGSSGHSLYKQKFVEDFRTDEYVFFVAFVPLKLVHIDTSINLWVNPRPSSPQYCRPIKFMFLKENSDLVRQQENHINTKIDKLMNYNKGDLRIHFEMLFTMLDGSVANVLTGTNASSKCFLCGASPKEMNLISVINRPVSTQNYRFGLSTLHSWIRFFECLLHISYRLQFKTWQVRGEENKKIFEENKKQIQIKFKSKMGLLVDKPKPGFGSTNDGNTARRFFNNPQLSAEITGIDKTLIESFQIILRVLASGCKINTTKFKVLLNQTRELYLKLYNWYYMPSTVHKILVHGCDVIEFFDLPIGQLSEEALEARHKEIRKIRLGHTRKMSRIKTNTDLIKMLLITSDPEISSKRKQVTQKRNTIDSNIDQYLIIDQTNFSYSLDIPQELSIETDDEDSESDTE